MFTDFRYYIVIPHFNHYDEFAEFLPALITTNLPCIVVDDGSDEEQLSLLTELVAKHDKIQLIRHHHNRGKGAAVLSGAFHARNLGASHVLQVDADGQHNSLDIPKFAEISQTHPDHIVCGRPVFDQSAPKARLYGRKVTDFWVALETLSLKIKDGLCGFRVYPLEALERLVDEEYLGKRMDFDTEVLVKAVWRNIPLKFIDTKVTYLEGGSSHFHYLRDNLLLIKLHGRLMFGMVWRLPRLLLQKLGWSFS